MPDPPRFTRRGALIGAAAAGAASILRPGVGLAAGRSGISSRWIGDLSAGAIGTFAAPAPPFSLVGVSWSEPEHPRIELRTRSGRSIWSPWVGASVGGHGPDRSDDREARFGEPLWSGDGEFVQLRSGGEVRGVRLHFIAAEARAADHAAGPEAPAESRVQPDAPAPSTGPLARPILPAGPGQPRIIARSAWAKGAGPAVPPSFGVVRLAFVHHTENPNGYSAGQVPAMLRAIYQFHRYVRGWDDIGYNFVIDAFGRIWEARAGGIDQAVVGAQAGGYNAVSTGVAVLGSFDAVVPSAAALDALDHLLAWKLSLHGVPTEGHVTVEVDPRDAFYTPFKPGAHVSLPRVAGHRDGDSTDCPGNAFYARLPALRPKITALAGQPAKLTLRGPTHLAAGGAPLAFTGRLTRLLDGAALAGATVELQSGRSPAALATATTAADGTFAFSVKLTRGARLRAVHRQAPAVVSDPLVVARRSRRRSG